MSWYYWKSEENLWTVGTECGTTDSDWNSKADAANRVHFLNGGTDATLRGENERLRVALQAMLTGYVMTQYESAYKWGATQEAATAHVDNHPVIKQARAALATPQTQERER